MKHAYIKFEDHESFNKTRYHLILWQETEQSYSALSDSKHPLWISMELIIYSRGNNWKWCVLRHTDIDWDYVMFESEYQYTNIEDACAEGYTVCMFRYDDDKELWPINDSNLFFANRRRHEK